MEAIFVLSIITVPCVVFIVWFLTPGGKRWRRVNNML